MRGISLIESISNFGWKSGLGFWYRWSIRDPIQMFIWLNITHKPYCTYSGFNCRDANCQHKHLLTKKEIKREWERMAKKMSEVETGKNGLCVYCGEEKGIVEIPNPNMDEINKWKVCVTCQRMIEQQQKMSIGALIFEKPYGQELGKKLITEAKKELDNLAYESAKEPFSAIIDVNKIKGCKNEM